MTPETNTPEAPTEEHTNPDQPRIEGYIPSESYEKTAQAFIEGVDKLTEELGLDNVVACAWIPGDPSETEDPYRPMDCGGFQTVISARADAAKAMIECLFSQSEGSHIGQLAQKAGLPQELLDLLGIDVPKVLEHPIAKEEREAKEEFKLLWEGSKDMDIDERSRFLVNAIDERPVFKRVMERDAARGNLGALGLKTLYDIEKDCMAREQAEASKNDTPDDGRVNID